MKRYFNYKSKFGLETIDQLNSEDFDSLKEFRKEVKYLLAEYRMAYRDGEVYTSQRACKEWTDTLKEATKKAKEQYSKEIQSGKLLSKAEKLAGIDKSNIIIYSPSSLSFFWRNDTSSAEDVRKIFEAFPPDKEGFVMKFANSSKNYATDSNIVIKWKATDTYSRGFKIHYTSNRIDISICVSHSFYENVWYHHRQGKHRGFGNYEWFRDYYLDSRFNTQKYSGGHCVYYFLEGAETLEEYVNFVCTGVFKYSNEL